ncbi:CU044_5270 family protein [Nonomuraea sp. NPDC002799]
MDDLELLQQLRADAPEPTADRLAPLRARLLATATTTPPETATTPLGDAATPPGTATTPPGDSATPLGDAVTPPGDAVTLADHATAVRRSRSRSLGRRALLSGLLAAGIAAVLVIARPPAPESAFNVPAPQTLRPGSISLLEQAALVAESRLTAAPRPDQWVYTKVKDVQPNTGKASIWEQWTRYDGKQQAGYDENGRMRISDVPPDPDDDDLSPQAYRAKLLKLPTDPDKLLAHVKGDRHWIDKPREEGVPRTVAPPDPQAYRVLSVYLGQQAVMPPKVEAAIYRALAKIPGVKIVVGMRDEQGREGIGLYYEPDGQEVSTRYLVLDPDTYRLLEDRMIWNRDEFHTPSGGEPELMTKAGSVWTVTELANGVVDRPGETS